ncbi:MAG TPA: heme-binding protein [Steroidobacter sp.]|uniref:GlcG/HbpS family heme-binding protein n=1 Tax=Steroidobacter sp. TaxID=1978227 RepID=UPI002ED90A0C
MPRSIQSLTLADARRIIAAGEQKAAELRVPYNIAVVDAGGELIAHARMDGAWLGSVSIAIDKAWTARAFDRATDEFSQFAQSGQPAFGIHTTNSSRVVIFGGGIPIKVDGVVIGAVGASGGSVHDDVIVARAAVAGFELSFLESCG